MFQSIFRRWVCRPYRPEIRGIIHTQAWRPGLLCCALSGLAGARQKSYYDHSTFRPFLCGRLINTINKANYAHPTFQSLPDITKKPKANQISISIVNVLVCWYEPLISSSFFLSFLRDCRVQLLFKAFYLGGALFFFVNGLYSSPIPSIHHPFKLVQIGPY